MTKETLEQSVLRHVLGPGYQAVKPRILAKKLGVPKEELPQFRRLVKRLVKSGQLAWGSRHLVYPPGGKPAARKTGTLADGKPSRKPALKKGREHVTGVFRRAQAGFGFVRPSGAGPGHQREHDVFVAAADSADASSGDVVLVELKKHHAGPGPRGRRSLRGRIVEIIERETNRFVGTYFESGGSAFVQVDGDVFARPIPVGDPGAKNAQRDDKVVFEMVRFPTQSHDGEGVIVEVLGNRGLPGIDTLSIIREYGLPDEFPEDVLAAAREEAAQFDESIPPSRLDLTLETIITIDPVDARDFDDAISLARTEKGHWMLGVHIADVAHFVKRGTPLDREAHHRATSVYLPDRVLPMLPEVISNALASLQPNKVRYTRTVFIEMTADGAPVAAEIRSSAIRSARRFTYEEVDDYLADREAWRSKLSPEVHALLGRMHELAMILRRRRAQRGALELSLSEVKVDLDKDGRVVGAHKVENTESHQIIEEFMLAANMAVAEALREADVLFLRRVHMAPDPRRLDALNEFVAELGFRTESLESRFALQKLLGEVTGKPEQHAVHYAVLRSLQQAVYAPEDEGHYALASDDYCHFTSPIRRYPDLTIHRLCLALENGRKPKNDLMELKVLGEHCSQRERRAESAERELTRVKLLNYMSERVGEQFDAIITGVEEFGLFAQGIELPAEGLIHITALADDYYSFDRRTHSLTGRREGNRFRLGDRVRVAVARVDVDRRELDLRVVGHQEREAPRPVEPRGKRAAGRKGPREDHRHATRGRKRGKVRYAEGDASPPRMRHPKKQRPKKKK